MLAIWSLVPLPFLFLVLPLYCYQPISLHPRAHMLSHVTPWTAARQAPLSMDFSRQEHWNGLPFPSPSSAFSKTSLNIWKFTVHVLLKPGLENFEHYFTSGWDECNCVVVWAFFGIAFLWEWNENWLFPVDFFQSYGHCWLFQICWYIECSTFTASSFRRWNSTGIPSPPLALFVVMLPKAHLTSHSRMSGSRVSDHTIMIMWVMKIFFVQFFCVFLPPLLNIFCFEISSLSLFVIFLYFFALFAEEGFLISPCYSLELCTQMGISFLFSFAFTSFFHSYF